MEPIIGSKRSRDTAQGELQHVNFIVGGLYYCIPLVAIRKYPGNFISAALKEEWKDDQSMPLVIGRDGENFRFVVEFYNYGSFRVRKEDERVDLDLFDAIEAEADFYNFPEMMHACAEYRTHAVVKRFRYVEHGRADANFDCGGALLRELSSLWLPFCAFGKEVFATQCRLTTKSTFGSIDLKGLMALATPVANNEGVFEISADKLNPTLNDQFSADYWFAELRVLFPFHMHTLTVRAMLIHNAGSEGYPYAENTDENSVGTLIYALNSAYTGGEISVAQAGNAEATGKLTAPTEWIAWHHGCNVQDSRVVQGTRVCLVFDVIQGEKRNRDDELTRLHVAKIRDNPARVGFERAPSDAVIRHITDELNKELGKCDDVVIGLSTLYPAFRTTCECLTAADATLHKILYDCGLYELTFTLTTVRYGEYPTLTGFVVDTNYALAGKKRGQYDEGTEDGEEFDEREYDDEVELVERVEEEEEKREVRLFVSQCAVSHVRVYDPKGFDGYGWIRPGHPRHLGREVKYRMYLVTGLVVRKKEG